MIDVSDGRALTEVLKQLDADVTRYLASPPGESVPIRTAVDQGKELAELYRKLAGLKTSRDNAAIRATMRPGIRPK